MEMPKIFKEALHEQPHDWKQMVARCDYYHNNKGDTCGCGIGAWRRLPTAVTEMICKCNKSYTERVGSLSAKGGRIGTYCLDCGMPQLTSIGNNYFTCEECSKYFTYNWAELDKVPAVKLCKDCDVPVTRLFRNPPTGIKFS